MTEAKGLFCP